MAEERQAAGDVDHDEEESVDHVEGQTDRRRVTSTTLRDRQAMGDVDHVDEESVNHVEGQTYRRRVTSTTLEYSQEESATSGRQPGTCSLKVQS